MSGSAKLQFIYSMLIFTTNDEYNKIYIRYPYIACEVICCEIASILDILVDGTVPSDNDNGLHVNDINHNI